MIYLLVPVDTPVWTKMRLFSSFSSLEQVVATELNERRSRGESDQWCFVIAYEGTDELSPLWGYTIYDGYLQRCTLTQ